MAHLATLDKQNIIITVKLSPDAHAQPFTHKVTDDTQYNNTKMCVVRARGERV